jgi:hypothetical protein
VRQRQPSAGVVTVVTRDLDCRHDASSSWGPSHEMRCNPDPSRSFHVMLHKLSQKFKKGMQQYIGWLLRHTHRQKA